ncbi:RNA polymerase subunit sigma [Acinetobacter sp. ANC 4558]|uniref:sigma-70 family RNA polymerase sigma factor n=1 Tax=Acinetobacter sp. ANC 4558 TaxID=1977876 RepID=UPI000A3470CE|nr:sigma-70 family RNA polymerase sigma factor [Acinetobacter sp. ANC 4558]OTG83155.1 RNA polymerase subunit sigma [Acinetobacter sp. ANC 4558]
MIESSHKNQVEQLYQEHHSWVYTWLYKKLGNQAQAADLAQDTFVRLLMKEKRLELNEPRAFITTIAKGLMKNWIERKQIEQAYLEVLSQQPELFCPSLEETVLIIESLLEVFCLLDGLPIIVRQVFLSIQVDGIKYDEVATQFNLSLSTVKRYTKQAYMQCLSAYVNSNL